MPIPELMGAPFISSLNRQVAMGPVMAEVRVGGIQIRGFFTCNVLGGAGGPLAVLFVAIIAAEFGKAVSKETKVDILVTPIVTILAGIGAAWVIAPPIGKAASAFGDLIMRTTVLQPFLMGILVSVLVVVDLEDLRGEEANVELTAHGVQDGADKQ